jgi:hypothetical protein
MFQDGNASGIGVLIATKALVVCTYGCMRYKRLRFNTFNRGLETPCFGDMFFRA